MVDDSSNVIFLFYIYTRLELEISWELNGQWLRFTDVSLVISCSTSHITLGIVYLSNLSAILLDACELRSIASPMNLVKVVREI